MVEVTISIVMQRSDVTASATSSQSVQRPSVTTSTPASLVMHASAAAPTAGVLRGITAPPGVQSSAPTKFDLLADFGGDPFVGPAKSTPASSINCKLCIYDIKMFRFHMCAKIRSYKMFTYLASYFLRALHIQLATSKANVWIIMQNKLIIQPLVFKFSTKNCFTMRTLKCK